MNSTGNFLSLFSLHRTAYYYIYLHIFGKTYSEYTEKVSNVPDVVLQCEKDEHFLSNSFFYYSNSM